MLSSSAPGCAKLLSGFRGDCLHRVLFRQIDCLINSTTARFDSSNSQRWLARQRSDPYVRRARIESYRCRSAFKLLELHERIPGGLLQPGAIVVDCGAAPGSWTQVAASHCTGPGRSGLVISFDLLDFASVPGARCYPHTDVRDWERCAQLVEQAVAEHQAKLQVRTTDCEQSTHDGQKGVTLVLSDMAPNASGVRAIDVPAMMSLASSVLQLALHISAPGASLVIKLWQCAEAEPFKQLVSRFYRGPWDCPVIRSPRDAGKPTVTGTTSRPPPGNAASAVRFMKPPASRSDSAEVYLVARGFQPDHLQDLA